MNDFTKLISNILTAPVYDIAKKTKLDKLKQLSNKLNNNIYAKREDLQPVFSFKCRGAYNKLIKLIEENPNINGVIAASAGNHAQGLAMAANKLKVKAKIVMPNITPSIKIEAVNRFGGEFVEVIINGEDFDAAAKYATQLQEKENLVFVHPFDDLDVIAGQGTIGKEIIEQLRNIDAIFIPVGGGGLIAGIGGYVKYLKPEIKIIGVEHEESASMKLSLENQKNTCLSYVGLFAEGVAVKRVGDLTFDICRNVVDEVITVTTDELCATINDIFDETRNIVEPAGAVALAGCKNWVKNNNTKNKNLVSIISGANMNFDRLRHVTERTSIGAKTECLLGVTIHEEKGSFKKLCKLIGGRAITEFNYRFSSKDTANIFIGITIKNADKETEEIIKTLVDNNYKVENLSDNDIAKLHLRYMVGGHSKPKNEMLFRFQFPERQGALLNFLENIADNNITLFHYRNHGSDYGRVLVGIEEPQNTAELFKLLDNIGYHYVDETNNSAYKMFL